MKIKNKKIREILKDSCIDSEGIIHWYLLDESSEFPESKSIVLIPTYEDSEGNIYWYLVLSFPSANQYP